MNTLAVVGVMLGVAVVGMLAAVAVDAVVMGHGVHGGTAHKVAVALGAVVIVESIMFVIVAVLSLIAWATS